MKTCCFTGHRPSKLKGYDPADNKELLWEIFKVVEDHIDNKGVTTFISGMALGIDMWAAKMILRVKKYNPGIKLICAIPCLNHASKWNAQSQKEWQRIVEQADEVFYVSNEEYKPYLMQRRNIWMVDESDYVIAVWDGSNGGTGNCVKYAQEEEKEITIIKPKTMKTYKGIITELPNNGIFVFGSNTQGRHGAGAAKVALNKFGAKYGQASGLQGKSYAIITKDLTKNVHPSITKSEIEMQILFLYHEAEDHPELDYYVAYSGTGKNLNYYTPQAMADMFNSFREPIPENIIFEEEFFKLIK